jgi:RNA polymerase sigma-70 factor (ECF subfamily)
MAKLCQRPAMSGDGTDGGNPAERGEVTGLLRAWRGGGESADQRLLDVVYGDLHRRAQIFLRHERGSHTLQPTALVHEAYLRLVDQRHVAWQDRAHFYAIAARSMRRVLLDHARKRHTEKRGSGNAAISLEDVGELARERPEELIRLDDALAELQRADPESAHLVELKFFAGLTLEEIAEALGCSSSTVERQWRAARAWLRSQLQASPPAPPS